MNCFQKAIKDKFANQVTEIQCPDLIDLSDWELRRREYFIPIFLAGGITNCEDWQRTVINYFKENWKEEVGIVFFNPRRDNFDVTNPNASKEQIEWEFKYLNTEGVMFSMYFADSESPQPICFYEMGRALAKNVDPMFIGTNEDFFRKADVLIQSKLACNRYKAIEVGDATDYAKKMMEFIKDNFNTELPLESAPGFCCWDCAYFVHTGGHGSSDWGFCSHSNSYNNSVLDDHVCKNFKSKN